MSTQGDKLKAIADAIRAKEGSSDPIAANDFPARIAAIETGTQLPTLTNPGTAADMAQGKQLIDQNGEIVTGTLRESTAGSGYTVIDTTPTLNSTNLQLDYTFEMDRIMRKDSILRQRHRRRRSRRKDLYQRGGGKGEWYRTIITVFHRHPSC